MVAEKVHNINKARDALDELSRQYIAGKITKQEFNLLKLPHTVVLGTRTWYNDDGTLK